MLIITVYENTKSVEFVECHTKLHTTFSQLESIAFSQSFQQVASLSRRDNFSVAGADLRSAMSQPPETYDLTTEQVRKEQISSTVTVRAEPV